MSDTTSEAQLGVRATDRKRRSVRSRTRIFMNALLKGDRPSAYRVADLEFADLGSRAAVFADLIHPAQYEIGELWYRGVIGVADEHRATALVETIVDRLPPTPTEDPLLGCRCVLAAVGAEGHVIGLRLLAAAMADDGWQVDLLGPGTSVEDLQATVDRVSPQLIGISAAYVTDVAQITSAVRLIKERGIPVLVGGAAFNRAFSLVEQVGADAHGADARVALTLARRLVGM